MSTFLTLAAAAEPGGYPLPMPPWGFWLLGIAVFAALLLFVWLFRHTAQTMIEGGHGPHQGEFAHGNAPEGRGHDGRGSAAPHDPGRRH